MRTFLTAEWSDLAMLNFEIEPAVLKPLVPRGTELDYLNGRTFVSVVGFLFQRARVFGVPFPFHTRFEEVNLRFYVVRKSGGELRRGVVFVKEIVPRRAIAYVARRFYGEPYIAMPMRHAKVIDDYELQLRYEWLHWERWNSIRVEATEPSSEVKEGSEEEFITEHYWGYTARVGVVWEYQVDHPRWRVRRAAVAELDCDVEEVYGRPFVEALSGQPTTAFVADGSPVKVRYRSQVMDVRPDLVAN